MISPWLTMDKKNLFDTTLSLCLSDQVCPKYWSWWYVSFMYCNGTRGSHISSTLYISPPPLQILTYLLLQSGDVTEGFEHTQCVLLKERN